MNSLNVKNLSVRDLMNQIDKDQRNFQNLKFNHHIKMIKNPIKIKFLRRKIAKLKTEYNKRINEKKM
ncbi:50S ribosomal protein L29 [Blattabacterium cuenoti]|uniref:50S ribosomal protein L29 n=1 Tax=Blattabacterium cuenoti TaxID=1653831 RepID=UPI00163C9BF6|nr:50S ribosomal protein L29 [Blattabacterium cuenoti]